MSGRDSTPPHSESELPVWFYLNDQQLVEWRKSALRNQSIKLQSIYREVEHVGTLTWLRALIHQHRSCFQLKHSLDYHLKYLAPLLASKSFPLTSAGKEFFQRSDLRDSGDIESIVAIGPLIDSQAVIGYLLLHAFSMSSIIVPGDEHPLLRFFYDIDRHALAVESAKMIHNAHLFQEIIFFDLFGGAYGSRKREPQRLIVHYALQQKLLSRAELREHIYHTLDDVDWNSMVVVGALQMAVHNKLFSLTEKEMICWTGSMRGATPETLSLPYLLCNNTNLSFVDFGRTIMSDLFDPPFFTAEGLQQENEAHNEHARMRKQKQIYTDDIIDLSIPLVQCGLPVLVCEHIVRFVLHHNRLRLIPFHYTYDIAYRVHSRWQKRKAIVQ